MSKEEESEKRWKYNGNEDEWDIFDRRMIRYMRKKYDRKLAAARTELEDIKDVSSIYHYFK